MSIQIRGPPTAEMEYLHYILVRGANMLSISIIQCVRKERYSMKIVIPALYEKDSKAFHRFKIKSRTGIAGSIYVPKGKEIPERIVLCLKPPGDKGKVESTDSKKGVE